jgi:hypothetical protein
MIISGGDSLSSISFLLPGVSEKKAISDADIIAERHKNNMEMTRAITELSVIDEN